jgi:hypothetical protein
MTRQRVAKNEVQYRAVRASGRGLHFVNHVDDAVVGQDQPQYLDTDQSHNFCKCPQSAGLSCKRATFLNALRQAGDQRQASVAHYPLALNGIFSFTLRSAIRVTPVSRSVEKQKRIRARLMMLAGRRRWIGLTKC